MEAAFEVKPVNLMVKVRNENSGELIIDEGLNEVEEGEERGASAAETAQPDEISLRVMANRSPRRFQKPPPNLTDTMMTTKMTSRLGPTAMTASPARTKTK